MNADWRDARDVSALATVDLETPGVTFRAGDTFYRTTGERLGHGGMGHAWHLDQVRANDPRTHRAVAKVFRWEFVYQLRQDPEARRHMQHNLAVLERIQGLRALHVLPVLCSQPLVDNHLMITPFAGESLVSLVLQDQLTYVERVGMLIQAVRGLRALHDQHIVHGDFTLRNILVASKPDGSRGAILFDFDLSIALDLLGPISYAEHYQGRIVGAPEYSLTPEQLDGVLEQTPLSPRRDIYAVGTALYNLFSDASVYGEAEDLPSLLLHIAEGVVRQGESRIAFPDEVPEEIRPVILGCLERDPEHRIPDASALIRLLERAQKQLAAASPAASGRFRTTLSYVQVSRTPKGLKDLYDARVDPSVSLDEIRGMHAALARQGYLLEKSLGRVKGRAIYLATPDPTLVATGRFQEENAYKKIVTAIDMRGRPDADAFLGMWLGRIVPVLETVRRGFLTALHKVVVDRPGGHLLLFSEFLDDPRFGTDLVKKELALDETLGLGLILANQVARLHEHGLAHNNVTLSSLLFKCLRETGQVKPVLVGLVEPSFAPEALEDDVRRLAAMILDFFRPARIEEETPEARPVLHELVGWLAGIAGTAPTDGISGLMARVGNGLASIDANFDILRRHGGEPVAYAYTLTRHSLYRHLWG